MYTEISKNNKSDRYNVSLDPQVSDRLAQIADNLGTSKPKAIELLVRHALDMYSIDGYDKSDIELILKGAPIE